MSSELLTIAGTLSAAVVAAFVSYLAGRGMKNHEWKLAQTKEELSLRRTLYSAFLAEAQRLIVQSSENMVHAVEELDRLHQLYAEITLVGSNPIVKAAGLVVDSVLLAHVREKDASDAGDFHVRKQAFVEAARVELQSYREA